MQRLATLWDDYAAGKELGQVCSHKLRQLIEAGTNLLWSAGSEGKKAEVQPGFDISGAAGLSYIR